MPETRSSTDQDMQTPAPQAGANLTEPHRNLAKLLAAMPDVGMDRDFERCPDEPMQNLHQFPQG